MNSTTTPGTVTDAASVTGQLARFVHRSQWQDLPATVQHEAVRAFVNGVGCSYGGASSTAVAHALAGLEGLQASGSCTVLGTQKRLDPLNATLVNGLSISAHAFDDAHLATVAHPGAPGIAALLAYAERHRVSGTAFLHALVLSSELQCRLSCALTVAPAQCELGWYMTGVTGAVGVAAGVGKLMGLSEQQLAWAMGLAAMQAGGLRASHGSMSSALIPGDAGRNGLLAAHLAAGDFNCHDDALGATHGLLQLFGRPANPEALTVRLGQHWECMNVSLKPFPAGCLTHAVIDACLQLVQANDFAARDIERVDLRVHPLADGLTGRKMPQHSFDAQASIYHWAAAVLQHRRAGLAEASDACVHDPQVIALRGRVVATVDETLALDAAHAAVTLRDGRRFEAAVGPCIGSAARPMTDQELDVKLLRQVGDALGSSHALQLSRHCWQLADSTDVGHAAPGFWGPAPLLVSKEIE
ncbi:MAG: MmgE/PrpD family protein [Comamonas sp.]|uniref:MmgE/PrpD family protein n=1 Tax=Comamonas sp. TaxID=34028 RepID=UPI002FCB7FB7